MARKEIISYALKSHLNVIANTLSRKMDQLYILPHTSIEFIGYYSLLAPLGGVVLSLPQSISSLYLGRFSKEKSMNLIDKRIVITLLLFSAMVFITVPLYKQIYDFEYVGYDLLSAVVIFGACIVGINSLMKQQLFAHKRIARLNKEMLVVLLLQTLIIMKGGFSDIVILMFIVLIIPLLVLVSRLVFR
jgi:O-antigen/teichoic acid export membrane protein